MEPVKTTAWVAGVLALSLAVPAEAKTKATIAGAIEVSTEQAGVDAQTLLTSAAAQSAVEGKLQWTEACGEVDADASHKVALHVDGNGAVTQVERLESTVADTVAACIDGVLKEIRTAALPTPDAKVKVVVMLSLVKTAEEAPVIPAPAPAPAASPAPEAAAPAPSPAAAAPPVAPEADPAGHGGQPPPADQTALANAEDTEDSKPWRASAIVGLSVGAGTFVSDSFARSPFFGYAVSLRGSYKLNDMITASLRMDFDQELTQSFTVNQNGQPNEFFFRELRLGASTKGLFKDEEYTGIAADASASLRLPTDKAGQSAQRIFGLVLGGTLKRAFEEVGPGTLTLTYTLSYRENVGPRAANNDDLAGTSFGICRAFGAEAGDEGNCVGPANTARSLSNGFTVEYNFLEKLTATVDIAWRNDFRWALNDGAAPPTISGPIRSSPNAKPDSVNQSDLVFSTIELAYSINDMFDVAAGVTTITDPFVHSDGGGYSLRFPFFDFTDAPYNTSTWYVQAGFTY